MHTRLERCAVLWMRRTIVVSLFVFILQAPSQASAQTPFEDLALRVNLDDQLQIEDQSGRKVGGRLTGLTPDEIVIQTDVGESRFTRDTVREVAVRGYGLRRGAFIGAEVFAILGAVATCAHGRENCAVIGPIAAAPIGAGVGLAIGALIPRMRPVYRASDDRVPVSLSHVGVPAGFLADLALRANLDDQIQVEDRSGVTTTGRLTHLTADEITIHSDAGEKHFTRETVRRVAVRRRPLRMAVLIGAGAGAAVGAVAACTGRNREECADAPMMAGALGAGLGLAAGALMHRTTIVYPEADGQVLILPVISRDAIGVRVSRQW
jgi:hypothetical protein